MNWRDVRWENRHHVRYWCYRQIDKLVDWWLKRMIGEDR